MATTDWSIDLDLGTEAGSGLSKTLTLNTANTYVDRNIVVNATSAAPTAAVLGASATGSAKITTATVGAKTSGAYPLTGSATISGTASASTTTSGWATKNSTSATGTTSGTASLEASIPAAAATVTLAGTAATPTVAIDAAQDNILASAATTTKPSSGYYAAIKATAPETTLTATKTVDTAGYLGVNTEITASGKTTQKVSNDYYIPITAGTLDNKATTNVTYTENTSVVIPSEGTLYINEGYYPATKITLDQILGGASDSAGISAPDIRTGKTAYDVDGKLLTGTMGNATITSGAITASAVTPSYNSTNSNFDVAITATAAAPTVNSTGYISSSVGTKNSNSNVTSSATLAKVALSTQKTSGNLTVAPTLVRTAKPADDTWVDAANGAAQSSKPTSGPYVQIDAAAATNTLKIKPTVSTAGYGDTTNYEFTEYSGSVGAAKAGTRYIPIKEGSATLSCGGISVTGGTPTLNSSTQKYDIAVSGSGSVSADVTAGWIESISDATVNASGTVSLKKAALTHGNTATETKAKVAVTATPTGVSTTTTATNYYITLAQGTVTAGSVKHSASVSEGYVPTAGLSTEATIATSAELSGAGKIYLQTTNITGSLNSAVTQSATKTDYAATLLTAAPSAGPYITLTGNGSGTAGKVYTGTATAANKYIKIFDGSYSIG